jgi:hypothetical protein
MSGSLANRLRRLEATMTQRPAAREQMTPVELARAVGIEPDPWQANVLASDARRLLLLCCRQAGKSTCAAIAALHKSLYTPRSLTVLVSASQRQASELFRVVRDLLAKLDHAPALTEDNRLSMTLDNGSRVVSLPSNERTVRGYASVDLLIEDEAAKVYDDLFRATLPMISVSSGQLILMSTAWGRRGHFYALWESGGPAWERVKVTGEQCPRLTPEILAEARATMGPLWYASEFACEFVDTADSVFSYDQVTAALSSDVTPLFDRRSA